MVFCDYCSCDDCKYGSKHSYYARTMDLKNICDVCYKYDLCIDAKRKEMKVTKRSGLIEPCLNLDCDHRPKLISDFKSFFLSNQ